MTVLIPDAVVRERFTMRDCIAAVARGYRAAASGGVVVSERYTVSLPDQARLISLSATSASLGMSSSLAYVGGPLGVDRSRVRARRRQKVFTVFDIVTGECVALVGGTTLSWLNTGATGAVAIDHMAARDARTLALVGAGRQARAALLGAMEVRQFDEVRVWSRTAQTAAAFAEEFADVADVVVRPEVESAVRDADVVITTTTAATPVVRGAWLSESCHVNLIGAHQPDRREVDADAIASATVVVDTLTQARAEKGELLIAEAEGRFSWSHVHAELGQVVTGERPVPPGARSVFASNGSGIEALAAVVGVVETVGADTDLALVELDQLGR